MKVSQRSLRSSWPLVAALVFLLLATTCFVLWQRQSAREIQAARWQEGFARQNAILFPLINLQSLRTSAKATLMANEVTPAAWENFLTVSEWRQHYPGLRAIGYLEPMRPTNGEAALQLTFTQWRDFVTGRPALDPTTDTALSGILNRWYNHSNGLAAMQLVLPFAGSGQSRQQVISFLPLKKTFPAGEPMSHWSSRPGSVLFFLLDQAEYYHSFQPRLDDKIIEYRLLAPDEPDPPRTATQRTISIDSITGLWRFRASLKPQPSAINFPPWLLLAAGLVLSGAFLWLFALQTRLRYQAEAARELVLAREAEILALNRGLEETISRRTAELNVALAEEKELNRLKSNFTSMVTHEIRTPLEIILSSTDILLRYTDRLPPERRAAHLHGIKSAVRRMNALMADVLLFSRAEAGRMNFKPTPLELVPLCKTIVDEIQSATSRRCPIRLAVSGVDEPARVDENLLRHILTNLLSNAVKYSPVGSEVTLTVSRVAGEAVFNVKDAGMGIPEEDQRRIFTPFYRGGNAATIQGTGLGLVIVKHCAEQHGGTIEVESAPGAGTQVSVRLPLFLPANPAISNRTGESQKSA